MADNSDRRERAVLTTLLREIRQQAGLTQADLAKRLGKPQPYVSRYETGERRLDVLEFRRVCQACGVSSVEIMQRLDRLLKRTEAE